MEHSTHHINLQRLARFAARIEDLFSEVSACRQDTVPAELADEVAATAGEIMLALAGHESDDFVRGALADARRLREAARTLRPERSQIGEAGAALARDVSLIIRHDKQAA
jgi:hypothetical protein